MPDGSRQECLRYVSLLITHFSYESPGSSRMKREGLHQDVEDAVVVGHDGSSVSPGPIRDRPTLSGSVSRRSAAHPIVGCVRVCRLRR